MGYGAVGDGGQELGDAVLLYLETREGTLAPEERTNPVVEDEAGTEIELVYLAAGLSRLLWRSDRYTTKHVPDGGTVERYIAPVLLVVHQDDVAVVLCEMIQDALDVRGSLHTKQALREARVYLLTSNFGIHATRNQFLELILELNLPRRGAAGVHPVESSTPLVVLDGDTDVADLSHRISLVLGSTEMLDRFADEAGNGAIRVGVDEPYSVVFVLDAISMRTVSYTHLTLPTTNSG